MHDEERRVVGVHDTSPGINLGWEVRAVKGERHVEHVGRRRAVRVADETLRHLVPSEPTTGK